MECKCEICRSACRHRPGWFRPGEPERAAEYLGLSLQDFFDKFLAVDYWSPEEALEIFTFLLAPARKGMEPGEMYPFEPRGTCVFFDENELCAIHPVKPFECAFYDHTNIELDECFDERRKTVEEWKKHQEQVEELLGHKPVVPMPSNADFFSMLFDGITKGML